MLPKKISGIGGYPPPPLTENCRKKWSKKGRNYSLLLDNQILLVRHLLANFLSSGKGGGEICFSFYHVGAVSSVFKVFLPKKNSNRNILFLPHGVSVEEKDKLEEIFSIRVSGKPALADPEE